MKKMLSILMCVVILMGFTSCSSKVNTIEGQDLIASAQKAYKALDSARLVITDADTGKVQQQFTFCYDDKVLHYLFESTSGGKVYYEYNNGKNVQIQKSGKVKTYKWPNSNFKKYKRSGTHPNADTGIFFFEPKYISDIKVDKTDGNTEVFYSYDIKKLAKKMTTKTTDGKMTVFETKFIFDKNGNFQKLLETSSFDNDGEKISHTYSVEITDRNEIKEIVNPIKD